MITWNTTDLASALLSALIAEHGDDGSDTSCHVCALIDDARLHLDADHRKPHVRGPVAQADQWPARDHEYDGRGRNHG
jgi:hypothetical protein